MKMRRQYMLLLDTLVLGIVGALSARLFVFLLDLCRALFLDKLAGYHTLETHGNWLIPLSTTLGGLLSGLLVYSFAPEAEGHGTDAVVNAFHNLAGQIRARVPLIKTVASAITIGSGGSAGREGPTALISAGVGSIYANWFHRSDEDRRLLIVVGMAAGLSAVFRSPIGTAFFAVEVLYGEMEFEAGALVYTMLASITAYALNGFFVGFEPLFVMPGSLTAPDTAGYAWYVVLGVASALVATILPLTLYGVRDAFHRIPCPPHLKPAIGGLCVGLVAVALPQVLGGGYEWIQAAIDGRLGLTFLLLLSLSKMITFAFTIGSGGSGGVFAPSLFVGAMFGGFLGQVFHQQPAAFVVVGMAAVFGAAARVPVATLLMVTEMTGGYHLLVAAGLAVMLSYLLQTRLVEVLSLRYPSLYEAQVPTRSYSPAHYRDQLRTAMDLLRSREISKSLDVRGLELVSLVASGVPVRFPDGREVKLGVLRRKSPCVGKTLEGAPLGPRDQMEFILILRHDRPLWPHPGLTLEEGDRLVAIASDAAWTEAAKHLDSVPRPKSAPPNR
jgi:chloride channel protein, CIC family